MLLQYSAQHSRLDDMAVGEALPLDGWVHAAAPTEQEFARLTRAGFPHVLLLDALDADEIAHFDHLDDVQLFVVRHPRCRPADHDLPYRSAALGMLVRGPLIVTVTSDEGAVLTEFAQNPGSGGLHLADPPAFLLQLVMHIAKRFLSDVRTINAIVDRLEARLKSSLGNREVLELLKYQKGLIHFTTALESNRILLRRLPRNKHAVLSPEAHELLGDVRVEVDQAIEMAGVSADILSQMMDAFASIISNNLNVVVKVLTALTIVISVPTLIASVFGMNVPFPGQSHPWAFVGIVAGSFALSLGVVWLFLRRRWL